MESAVVSEAFRLRAEGMPEVVRRLIIGNCCPEEVSVELLFASLRMPRDMRRLAVEGLCAIEESALFRCPGALSAQACATLRDAVDAHKQAIEDTVDGAPDHQRDLSRVELGEFIGTEAVNALWELPACLACSERQHFSTCEVRMFVRRYTVDSRPWNPFHTDSAVCTVNVALVGDASFGGGDLVACYDGAVHTIHRSEGEATVHSSTLLHAVTSMLSGVRYSLIMFFGQPELERVIFDDVMRDADDAAFRVLLADDELLDRVCRVCDLAGDVMQSRRKVLTERADLGKMVELVVGRYNAPALRPSLILSRESVDDTSCWSLRNLVMYATQGMGPGPEVVGEEGTTSS